MTDFDLRLTVLVIYGMKGLLMRITFDEVTVINVTKAVSSKGRPFGKLQMLTSSFDVYDLFIPGNKVGCLDGIQPHTKLSNVPFDLVSGFNGGVQLVPAWDEKE